MGRRERKLRLERARERVADERQSVERAQARIEQVPELGEAARRECRAADHVLRERERQELLALQLRPPAYIDRELGPADPAKARAWDHGVKVIEGYRKEHGITDPKRALGERPTPGLVRDVHDDTLSRVRETQQRLQLTRQLQQRTLERKQRIELDLRIGGR